MMSAKLIAEEGILKGLVLYLDTGNEWTIGRDPNTCEFVVEDPDAAKIHARCFITEEGIAIENLSATNPTEVNGLPIEKAQVLNESDTVKVGSSLFRFHLSEVPTPIDLEREAEKTAPANFHKKDQIQRDIDLSDKNLTAQPKNEQEENPIEKDDIFPIEEHAKVEEKFSAKNTTQQPIENNMAEQEENDSIFEDQISPKENKDLLAEINFDLMETGRWLLKVVAGPNSGAEFSMQASTSYLIGTDPNTCDIVFHDTSVSRQHARITVSDEDTLVLEDLKSRNGTHLDGKKVEGRVVLEPNIVVSVGTTSFIVFDREGEMQTIISPMLPSIVKALQQEEPKDETSLETSHQNMPLPEAVAKELEEPVRKTTVMGAFVLVSLVTGLFVIVGMGTLALFRSEPVAIEEPVNVNSVLEEALSPFSDVTRSYTPSTGRLLLVGHVSTAAEKNQLIYNLQGLPFIRDIDDKSIIIDEYVTREINPLISRTKAWRGVTLQAPKPGVYVLTGYLQTREQADRLFEYITVNFPNLAQIERRVIVEEDIINTVESLLQKSGIRDVKVKINNNLLTLSGGIPAGKEADYNRIIEQAKAIPGIRDVRSYVNELPAEATLVNISDKYKVSGASNQGGVNLSVVINGRIVSRGDSLDGMTITSIKPNVIFLEKEGIKYRIDY